MIIIQTVTDSVTSTHVIVKVVVTTAIVYNKLWMLFYC